MHPFPSGVFVDKHGRAFEFVGDEVHNLDGFERLEFVRKISRPNLLILTQDGERYSAEFDDKQITWRDGKIWFKKTGEQAKAALEKHKPKTPTRYICSSWKFMYLLSYGKPDDIGDSGGNLHDSNDGWASRNSKHEFTFAYNLAKKNCNFERGERVCVSDDGENWTVLSFSSLHYIYAV